MCAPKRYTAMIPSVKPIFRRRSGVRMIRAIALNKEEPPSGMEWWAAKRRRTDVQSNGKGRRLSPPALSRGVT
ncbi:hypothetical protein GCM10017576_07890 [Microbacterium barkeri]|uniref:Uncharacterized protein n=1 Tax=Microbacterium barkeri TaxID=33917 RepID=A0A9W6H1C6_9MICO|nr:hypothetical protein GCM10017576_07890 [Microbacterium barkeri]